MLCFSLFLLALKTQRLLSLCADTLFLKLLTDKLILYINPYIVKKPLKGSLLFSRKLHQREQIEDGGGHVDVGDG